MSSRLKGLVVVIQSEMISSHQHRMTLFQLHAEVYRRKANGINQFGLTDRQPGHNTNNGDIASKQRRHHRSGASPTIRNNSATKKLIKWTKAMTTDSTVTRWRSTNNSMSESIEATLHRNNKCALAKIESSRWMPWSLMLKNDDSTHFAKGCHYHE